MAHAGKSRVDNTEAAGANLMASSRHESGYAGLLGAGQPRRNQSADDTSMWFATCLEPHNLAAAGTPNRPPDQRSSAASMEGGADNLGTNRR